MGIDRSLALHARGVLASLCVWLVLSANAHAQTAANPLIARVTDWSAQPASTINAASDISITLKTASFSAFGRRFELELQSNDRIKSGLDPQRQAQLGELRLYGGALARNPGSWLRLADRDGEISGLIWDGADFWALESDATGMLVYRSDDDWTALGGTFRGDMRILPRAPASPKQDAGLSPLDQKLILPVDPGRTLSVGIIADELFVAAQGADTESDLLQMMNIVDGIFLWQLGVRIEIAELLLLDSDTDPFTSSDVEPFLDELTALKTGTPALASLGLVHLFTGRDLTDPESESNLIGVANFGTVCDTTYGVGITEDRDSIDAEARIAAHEIGHNFGAPHDNEAGSVCEAEARGFLMENTLNGSETFSQCSIDEMVVYAEAAPCLVPWLENDLSLRVINGSGVVELGDSSGFLLVAVDTNGVGPGTAVEVVIELAGSVGFGVVFERTELDWTCENVGNPRRCAMSYLPQGETAEFFIDFNTLSVGAGSVTVTVNGGNDPDASNDSIEFSVEVPGSADLESMVSVDPGQSQVEGAEVFRLNQPVSFSASIENLAKASATGVETRVRFDSDTTDHQINWPGVSCVIDILPYWFVCDVGTLAPGEQRAFGVSLRTPATGRADGSSSGVFVSINVDGDQSDPNLANNQSNASVTVAQAIFDLELGVTGADPIVVGELAAVEISLRNLGPDAAREVSLDTYHLSLLPPELEVLSASSDSAVCSLNEFTRQLFCDPIDSLASGETLQVAIELRASEPLRFRFEVGYTFRGYETIPANGRTAFELVAEEPAPEPEPEPEPAPAPAPAPTPSQPSSSGGGGGGGGGGALDWLSLLLLAVARWRFRARQADCSRRRRTAGAGISRRA